MITATKETILTKDLANNKIQVVREFDAPVERVWKAWTEAAVLDKWWAPKPYQAKTKTMDFRPGGIWLYSMVGPDNSEFCRADFKTIVDNKTFSMVEGFCDEDGKMDNQLPVMQWKCEFIGNDSTTKVEVEISFNSQRDLEKILEMGFQEGFAAAHTNLDELLAE